MAKSKTYPVVHFELGCKDIDATSRFYQSVFNWEITPKEHSNDVDTGSGVGVQGHITALGHEPHKYVNIYIQTPDIEETVAEVKENGGKLLIGPIPLPDGSTFAWIEDVAGNTVGLITAKSAE